MAVRSAEVRCGLNRAEGAILPMTIPQFAKGERVKIRPGNPWGGEVGTVEATYEHAVDIKLDSGDVAYAALQWVEHVSYTPSEPPKGVPEAAPLSNHSVMPKGRR